MKFCHNKPYQVRAAYCERVRNSQEGKKTNPLFVPLLWCESCAHNYTMWKRHFVPVAIDK